MLDAFDLAQLVLDEVEMCEGGVGVRRGRGGVVERRDGADEVEGEVEGAVYSTERVDQSHRIAKQGEGERERVRT